MTRSSTSPEPPVPLRVGLIGFGRMGRHHLGAIASTKQARIVGVADPVVSADELASLLPDGALVTADANDMLARARPDVVHIVTPPATHAELAVAAIEAGCHVYVEKPFTPGVLEARRILDLAARREVRVCAGHQVLFEAPALALREAIGQIGSPVHVESHFAFRMVRRTISAADQVNDILPHAVYPVVEVLQQAAGENAIEVVGVVADARGELRALLRAGAITASITVTLTGRPIDHYLSVIGTNGSLRADFIGGFLDRLVGPGAGPGALLTPYRRALHAITGSTRGIARLMTGGSYPGLRALVARFYESIRNGTAPPLSSASILSTVELCEELARRLAVSEEAQEGQARERLRAIEAALPVRGARPRVLLTGGTGLLGSRIATRARDAGFGVRVVTRHLPPFTRRVAGVEYAVANLANPLDASLFEGIDYVVHAAAETAGGKEEHRRNSVEATQRVAEASARAGVRGMLHVSSLAVLQTSRETGQALDEQTPLALDAPERGPYVWGKAESEALVRRRAGELGLALRVIRPGPLVDYAAFQPPGRLGRELGPLFVAVGPRRSALAVCDVDTAARVVCAYLADFDRAPPVLNLVEAPAPSRRDLVDRLLRLRPDLRVLWVPAWVLRVLSGPLKFVQRRFLSIAQPVDVATAFASERYRTDLAAQVISHAQRLGDAAADPGMPVPREPAVRVG